MAAASLSGVHVAGLREIGFQFLRGDPDRLILRGMGRIRAVLLAVVFLAAEMPQLLGSPVTGPAFLWSPQHFGSSQHDNKEFVDYRTFSPKDLTKSVLSEGGWSNVVVRLSSMSCHRKQFITNWNIRQYNLQTSDISSIKQPDPSLIDILKLSFTTSNFSMAFPYVAIDEQEMLENSLVKGFAENCGQGLGVNRIAYLDSCSLDGGNKKLEGLHSVHDILASRISGKMDLIVLCSGDSKESDRTPSEGEALSNVVDMLKQSGAKYTILYASRPYRTTQYPAHLAVRFLAESPQGQASANSTCDGVCQIKSSLLEGIFVAIVLLIILISGLCCMIGIDTPSRFETPQES
ncbi:unnamed protein product [Musa acuminata subsp. malaccensis]|uniref:(wild Malaysian banana) hypothetical protein n=1 Tax=Musa acuminata subsp. malaccensis TaxID=214687 RepID=A0A8D7AXB1_MUSAM|nr:unnamed protein product [Musa acuminata subsp. malaccensis]